MAAKGRTRRPIVVITGGAGFLGRALVRELLAQRAGLAPRAIRVLDTRPAAFDDARVHMTQGDIRSASDLRAVCRGADVVFHAAALVDWGSRPARLVEEVNVAGTRQVVRVCREAGVRALVFTSSEDAVYTGRPIRDADESLPYPRRFPSAYCRTKAEAEKLVLAADGLSRARRGREKQSRLRTTVLRPGGMFGEGDPYHASSLIRMARRGLLFRIGDGRARCMHVYVGNVAHAHLLAARSLLDGGRAAGQVYFVTDFPARNFFDFLEPIVEGAGLRMYPRWCSLPRPLMRGLGISLDAACRLLAPMVSFTPLVSRFSVDYVCQDFTFSSEKAARELGYRPVYSEVEALRRTIEAFAGRET